MKDEMKLSLAIVATVMATALPLSARAQDNQGLQIRGFNRIDTTVRLDRGGAVDLSLVSGRIRVTGWDRPDVKVTASVETGRLSFAPNSSRVTLSGEDSDHEGGGGGQP